MIDNLVTFRTLTFTDAPKLFHIYSDKEAMKYRGSKPIETIDDAKDFIANQSSKKEQTLTIRKGVILTQTKDLIGTVMFRYQEQKTDICEIGYSIGRRYWGQGLGKEIVKLMIKDLSENKNINDIIAWSHKENLASIKILERFDFLLSDGKGQDEILLYKLKIIR